MGIPDSIHQITLEMKSQISPDTITAGDCITNRQARPTTTATKKKTNKQPRETYKGSDTMDQTVLTDIYRPLHENTEEYNILL